MLPFSPFAPFIASLRYMPHRCMLMASRFRLAILGLTDHFVHERIEREPYMEAVVFLQSEGTRLNPESDAPSEVRAGAGAACHALCLTLLGAFRMVRRTSRCDSPWSRSCALCSCASGRCTRGALQGTADCDVSHCRLPGAGRSMVHSPYVASRLGIWRENGRRRLNDLLAKMGCVCE